LITVVNSAVFEAEQRMSASSRFSPEKAAAANLQGGDDMVDGCPRLRAERGQERASHAFAAAAPTALGYTAQDRPTKSRSPRA
jgi:hypothetical protein